MQFSPKLGAIFSAVALLISVIAVLSPSAFPSYVPNSVAAAIISTAAFATILLNALNGALHLYSSSAPGPLAPADPAVVLAATRVADLSPTASPSDIVAAKSAANAAVARHMP
jgi:hypothetical protein